MTPSNPDPFWESEIYSRGLHFNLYPFDAVVSFLFRWTRGRVRDETNVLEIGCGAGNNLWFAAREGFRVAGIDGSESAIDFAKRRFAQDKLNGDLRIGTFLDLPWQNETFDIGIDRASLVCVGHEAQRVAIIQMHRVLRSGGVFFFNGYSDEHTSAKSGEVLGDGRVAKIRAGKLAGVGALSFNSRSQIDALFAEGWEIKNVEQLILLDHSSQRIETHAEWRVVARKK